jgi:hypothetical protein
MGSTLRAAGCRTILNRAFVVIETMDDGSERAIVYQHFDDANAYCERDHSGRPLSPSDRARCRIVPATGVYGNRGTKNRY